MKYRLLGRTFLKVSEIGLGTWPISGNSYGLTDDDAAIEMLRKALDHGVTFFDTADIYGNGHSETLLGQALSDRRDEFVLATKAGWDFYGNRYEKKMDGDYLSFACEQSLQRLNTSYLDVLQLHNPVFSEWNAEESYEALEALKRRGLIRFYGVSVHTADEARRVIADGRADTIQIVYNLIRQADLVEILSVIQKSQIGVIAREPLGCGMLTGKYTKQTRFSGADHRKRWKPIQMEADLDKLELLKTSLEPKDGTTGRVNPFSQGPMPELAMEFVLACPGVSTVIPGAKNWNQFRDALRGAESMRFTARDLETLKKVATEHPLFHERVFFN